MRPRLLVGISLFLTSIYLALTIVVTFAGISESIWKAPMFRYISSFEEADLSLWGHCVSAKPEIGQICKFGSLTQMFESPFMVVNDPSHPVNVIFPILDYLQYSRTSNSVVLGFISSSIFFGSISVLTTLLSILAISSFSIRGIFVSWILQLFSFLALISAVIASSIMYTQFGRDLQLKLSKMTITGHIGLGMILLAIAMGLCALALGLLILSCRTARIQALERKRYGNEYSTTKNIQPSAAVSRKANNLSISPSTQEKISEYSVEGTWSKAGIPGDVIAESYPPLHQAQNSFNAGHQQYEQHSIPTSPKKYREDELPYDFDLTPYSSNDCDQTQSQESQQQQQQQQFQEQEPEQKQFSIVIPPRKLPPLHMPPQKPEIAFVNPKTYPKEAHPRLLQKQQHQQKKLPDDQSNDQSNQDDNQNQNQIQNTSNKGDETSLPDDQKDHQEKSERVRPRRLSTPKHFPSIKPSPLGMHSITYEYNLSEVDSQERKSLQSLVNHSDERLSRLSSFNEFRPPNILYPALSGNNQQEKSSASLPPLSSSPSSILFSSSSCSSSSHHLEECSVHSFYDESPTEDLRWSSMSLDQNIVGKINERALVVNEQN